MRWSELVWGTSDSFKLLSGCPTKIESIESYGSKLLLECTDGSLQIYALESSGSDCSPTSDYHNQTLQLKKELYVLKKNVVSFSRKLLVSMEVLESRELLLSISESINFIGFPIWRPLPYSPRKKAQMCTHGMIVEGSCALLGKKGFVFSNTIVISSICSVMCNPKKGYPRGGVNLVLKIFVQKSKL